MKESQSLSHLNRRLISEWGETQHINSVLAGHSANKAFYMLSKLALPCVLGRVYSRFIYIWVEDSVHEACSEMVRKNRSSDPKSNVKPWTQVYFRFPWEKTWVWGYSISLPLRFIVQWSCYMTDQWRVTWRGTCRVGPLAPSKLHLHKELQKTRRRVSLP